MRIRLDARSEDICAAEWAASAAKEAIDRGVVGGMVGPSYSSFSSREEEGCERRCGGGGGCEGGAIRGGK